MSATGFSIDEYARRQQVSAARQRARKPLVKRKKADPSAAASRTGTSATYTREQKLYLRMCMDKRVDPDTKLLAALRTNAFLLTLDAFGQDELDAHMGFLASTTFSKQIGLSLGSVDVKRDLRNKFDRLGIEKAHAFSKHGATTAIKSACLAAHKTPTLVRLRLAGIQITPAVAPMLAKAITSCPLLESVSLAHSRLGNNGLEVISVALGRSPRLQQLSLSGCSLTEKASEHISKIITLHGVHKDEDIWSSSLRGERIEPHTTRPAFLLDLSDNALGDEAAEALSNALYHDKWLLGLNLNQNQLTRQGLVMLANTLAQSNSTLAICMINDMQDAVDRTMRNRLDGILQNRRRHLRHLTAESNEKRLYLCTLLLEWGVERELVLAICQGQKETAPTTDAATKSHELQTIDHSNQSDHDEPLHELTRAEPSPSNQHEVKPPPTEAVSQIDHVQTIEFLLERLSVLEASQKRTQEYVGKVEAENQELRERVNRLSAKKTTVTSSVEERIIAQLEASITSLAEQVHMLEQGKEDEDA